MDIQTTQLLSSQEALSQIDSLMQNCTLCPRACHANRLIGATGFCRQSSTLSAARAAMHYWEEPCISGTNGSGAVFFSGCNLQCVFCQNHEIALSQKGRSITPKHLSDIFLTLQEKGAHNINLVTPSHFIPQICYAILYAKDRGLSLPIIYNSSSYEEVSSLRLLDGLVDIYLPDLKYFSPDLGEKYSHAPNYFEKASAAISEMFRQVGKPVFSNQLLTRGIIVRHLILPGQTKDSKKILRFLHETYHDDIYISIMNQYTPLPHVASIPELSRKVSSEEYHRVLRFADAIGIQNGFIQEGDCAQESFIPEFNFKGIL